MKVQKRFKLKELAYFKIPCAKINNKVIIHGDEEEALVVRDDILKSHSLDIITDEETKDSYLVGKLPVNNVSSNTITLKYLSTINKKYCEPISEYVQFKHPIHKFVSLVEKSWHKCSKTLCSNCISYDSCEKLKEIMRIEKLHKVVLPVYACECPQSTTYKEKEIPETPKSTEVSSKVRMVVRVDEAL